VNKQLTAEQKITNIKNTYANVKEFMNLAMDTIDVLHDWLDISDIELNQKITSEALDEILTIASDSVGFIEHLKSDYLDSGLRRLSLTDPTMNNNGTMSADEQNNRAIQFLQEKINVAKSYLGNLDPEKPTFTDEVTKYLSTLTITAKREICQITVAVFLLLKGIVPLTIEDFLLQCKEELGIEFTKL